MGRMDGKVGASSGLGRECSASSQECALILVLAQQASFEEVSPDENTTLPRQYPSDRVG